MEQIAIIGAGNLGLSIASGLIENNIADYASLTLTQRRPPGKELLDKGFQVSLSNVAAVQSSKIVIVCVQPHQLDAVLSEVKEHLTSSHLVISVITGVSLSKLQAGVPSNVPVVRAMPNTATAVGQSMTCLAFNTLSIEHTSLVESLFKSIGDTLVIEEELMQAATVLGASGIAFLMRYLRAATQAGVQMGFDSKDAQKIAVQTAKGAAVLLQENETHPEMEIDKVTTPKGCTIEGLNEMEHQGFSSALIKGVMTSFTKINTIKKEL